MLDSALTTRSAWTFLTVSFAASNFHTGACRCVPSRVSSACMKAFHLLAVLISRNTMNHNNNPNRSNRSQGDGKGSNEGVIHIASSSQDMESLQRAQSDEDDGYLNNMSLLALLSRGSSLPDLRTTRDPLPPPIQSAEINIPISSSSQDHFRSLRSILDQAIHAMDRHNGASNENTDECEIDEAQVEQSSEGRRRPPKQ
jgi:hypothetical protein